MFASLLSAKRQKDTVSLRDNKPMIYWYDKEKDNKMKIKIVLLPKCVS